MRMKIDNHSDNRDQGPGVRDRGPGVSYYLKIKQAELKLTIGS